MHIVFTRMCAQICMYMARVHHLHIVHVHAHGILIYWRKTGTFQHKNGLFPKLHCLHKTYIHLNRNDTSTVLSDIIQEALSKKTNEHAEVMKEVVSLSESLEQKVVTNENS